MITAANAWRASRNATISTPSVPKRFDAPAMKPTRGWSGVTWRDLQ